MPEKTESKKTTALEAGMYSAEIVKPLRGSSYAKGDVVEYHSSTMQVLVDKGVVKNVKIIKNWAPKNSKK